MKPLQSNLSHRFPDYDLLLGRLPLGYPIIYRQRWGKLPILFVADETGFAEDVEFGSQMSSGICSAK